jgi:hypothetical protein
VPGRRGQQQLVGARVALLQRLQQHGPTAALPAAAWCCVPLAAAAAAVFTRVPRDGCAAGEHHLHKRLVGLNLPLLALRQLPRLQLDDCRALLLLVRRSSPRCHTAAGALLLLLRAAAAAAAAMLLLAVIFAECAAGQRGWRVSWVRQQR